MTTMLQTSHDPFAPTPAQLARPLTKRLDAYGQYTPNTNTTSTNPNPIDKSEKRKTLRDNDSIFDFYDEEEAERKSLRDYVNGSTLNLNGGSDIYYDEDGIGYDQAMIEELRNERRLKEQQERSRDFGHHNGNSSNNNNNNYNNNNDIDNYTYPDEDYNNTSFGKSSSKIPVSLSSPVPISARGFNRSNQYNANDTPAPLRHHKSFPDMHELRAQDNNNDDGPVDDELAANTLYNAKTPVKRPTHPSGSARTSLSSSANNTPSTRKTSLRKTPSVMSRSSSHQRGHLHRSRSVSSSAYTRPKHHNVPTGSPPWMIQSNEPILHPDQQLIPTVRKRLEQEAWANERDSGIFVRVWDKNLKPLVVERLEKEKPQETGFDFELPKEDDTVEAEGIDDFPVPPQYRIASSNTVNSVQYSPPTSPIATQSSIFQSQFSMQDHSHYRNAVQSQQTIGEEIDERGASPYSKAGGSYRESIGANAPRMMSPAKDLRLGSSLGIVVDQETPSQIAERQRFSDEERSKGCRCTIM